MFLRWINASVLLELLDKNWGDSEAGQRTVWRYLMVGERAPGRGRTKQRKAQNNAFLQVLTDVSISAAALCKHGGAPSVLAEGRPPVCIRRCVFIVSGSVRRDSDLKPTGLVVLKETIHQQSQWRRIPLNMDVCLHLFLHARALFCFFTAARHQGWILCNVFGSPSTVCVRAQGRSAHPAWWESDSSYQTR